MAAMTQLSNVVQSEIFHPRKPYKFRTGSRDIHRGTVTYLVDRDSSVSIVTRYGLDGLGNESRCVRDLSYHSRPALGPTQPPKQWV